MPYATPQEFIEKFGRDQAIALTNLDDPSAEEVDLTALNRALTDASAQIDSYLAGRYALPFASVPQVLIPKCLDLAHYALDRYAAREDIRQRCEDAIRWLELVAKGTVELGLNALNTEVKRGENLPDFAAVEPTFTNDTLKDFVGS